MRVLAAEGAVEVARSQEPEARQGYIYFIRAGKSGSIKIGYSIDPKGRLRRLQTSLPHRLTMLATRPGTMEDEGALHTKFAHLRKSGEWFTPARELIDHIFGWTK